MLLCTNFELSFFEFINCLFSKVVSLLNDDESPFISSLLILRPVSRQSHFDVSCCVTISQYVPADVACQHALVSDLPVFMFCISVGKAPFIRFPSLSLTTYTCLKLSSVCLNPFSPVEGQVDLNTNCMLTIGTYE